VKPGFLGLFGHDVTPVTPFQHNPPGYDRKPGLVQRAERPKDLNRLHFEISGLFGKKPEA